MSALVTWENDIPNGAMLTTLTAVHFYFSLTVSYVLLSDSYVLRLTTCASCLHVAAPITHEQAWPPRTRGPGVGKPRKITLGCTHRRT